MVTRSFISNSLVVEYYYFLYYYLYYYLLHCTPGRSSTIAGVDGPHMSPSLFVRLRPPVQFALLVYIV